MAGLDGIQNRTEPPGAVDNDLYDLPPEELAKVQRCPDRWASRWRRSRTITIPIEGRVFTRT